MAAVRQATGVLITVKIQPTILRTQQSWFVLIISTILKREVDCDISFSRKPDELARVAVYNHKPTTVIDDDPKNNEEKHKKDEPLYSRIDGQHFSSHHRWRHCY